MPDEKCPEAAAAQSETSVEIAAELRDVAKWLAMQMVKPRAEVEGKTVGQMMEMVEATAHKAIRLATAPLSRQLAQRDEQLAAKETRIAELEGEWACEDGLERCKCCHRRYETGWAAPDELWYRIAGRPGGMLCPMCFDLKCRAAGVGVSWRVRTADDTEEECQRWQAMVVKLAALKGVVEKLRVVDAGPDTWGLTVWHCDWCNAEDYHADDVPHLDHCPVAAAERCREAAEAARQACPEAEAEKAPTGHLADRTEEQDG